MLLPLTLVALWLQLYWSLIPTWRDGEYYAYGWFVAPLALAFAWRRWQMRDDLGPAAASGNRIEWTAGWGVALILVVAAILPLRVVGEADPTWRPPLLLHALLVAGATHALLWRAGGRRLSLFLLPVTIFALSAVPLPWRVEQVMVRSLTGAVIALAAEVFLLAGRPVEILGERLAIGGDVVAVTDGCSGIRSLQSLGMAALFFGELLFLGWGRRLLLIGAAGIFALVLNAGRAWWLAELHFSRGAEAAAAAHDMIGHLAFALSAAGLYGAAWLLQGSWIDKRKVVVRTTKANGAAVS